MDLAQTFNHAGCILFEQKQYTAAYDAFCAAHQALWYSANGRRQSQLDGHQRTMVILDPAIQRAYDQIAMSGLFKSTHHPLSMSQHRSDCSTCEINDNMCIMADHGMDDAQNRMQMRPIMMTILPPMDDMVDEENEDSSLLAVPLPFRLYRQRQQQELFVTNMAIVWTNKGLILQNQRRFDRSLTCYGLARTWMCQIPSFLGYRRDTEDLTNDEPTNPTKHIYVDG